MSTWQISLATKPGEISVTFTLCGASSTRSVSAASAVIYFECEDLDAKVAALKASALRFNQDTVDQPWLLREAHLLDPDGNAICLY